MSAAPGPVVHACPLQVRWRDLDAFNHVNNASFLGYIEEARVSWLRALSEAWADASSAPILAAIAVNYRRPIGWPESLVVELTADRLGTKSLTLGHRIVSAADAGTVYADGHTVLVWVDAAGATLPLPAHVRAACAG
jgi:acyl-CoA thioester hydrolase